MKSIREKIFKSIKRTPPTRKLFPPLPSKEVEDNGDIKCDEDAFFEHGDMSACGDEDEGTSDSNINIDTLLKVLHSLESNITYFDQKASENDLKCAHDIAIIYRQKVYDLNEQYLKVSNQIALLSVVNEIRKSQETNYLQLETERRYASCFSKISKENRGYLNHILDNIKKHDEQICDALDEALDFCINL